MHFDEKNIINLEGHIDSMVAPHKINCETAGVKRTFKIFPTIDIVSNFTAQELKEFNSYLKQAAGLFECNIKMTERALIPKAEINLVIDGEKRDLREYIDARAKEFIERKRKNVISKFPAKLISVKDSENIKIQDVQGREFNLILDLFDTEYSLFSKSEKKIVNNVMKKLISDIENVEVCTDTFLNFKPLCDIRYFEDGLKKSLKEEMNLLLNPYSETCEYGSRVFKAIISRFIDGDTVDVFNGKERIRMRLKGIDAPESKQEDGKKATAFLTRLAYEEPVKIKYEIENEKDDYERMVSVIYKRDPKTKQYSNDLNRAMVLNGHAWAIKGDDTYKSEENHARTNDLGMWIGDPVYPRKFRKNEEYYKTNKKKWKIQEEQREKRKNKKPFFSRKKR